VERLLQPTEGKVEFLERKQFESELRERYQRILVSFDQAREGSEEAKDLPRHQKPRIQREVYRAIGTSLRILRQAGLELREGFSESGVAYYARLIPNSLRFSVANSAHMTIKAMRLFVDYVSSTEDRSSQSEEASFKIRLTDIMDVLGGDVRIGRIKDLVKLVESAGFYEFEGGLNDWVTLVTLNTQEPLPAHAPDFSEDTDVQRVYTEMLEKHDLQVLRAQAMVLMAAMPMENRKKYIDSYFQCVDATGLTQLLEDTVGDVDDEVLANSPMLQVLLSQVRRERFSEEMEQLNDSQRIVCAAPFDRTLLVNAGPGSGKTHVLMMRCAHLIHKQRIDPAEILVLAFNRAVVYEIRDRIRRLFRAIGYGSYANRLAVTTFHSFALRFQQESELYEEDAIGQAVHTFAQRMASDSEFARFVGGGYKTVLVDEFQDMNQDFYSVVKVLLENCRGGGMVIGDDDQDILAWNRRQWQAKYRQACPLDAAHYFSEFRNSIGSEEHTLTRNYRSAVEIVARSSSMIGKAEGVLGLTRMKAGTELQPERTDGGQIEIPFNIDNCLEVVAQALERRESVAILCRSNRECRQNYDLLVKVNGMPSESVELLGSEDFPLYQMRHPGALLDICRARNDYDFVEPSIWEEFIDEFMNRGMADSQVGQRHLELIYELVKAEVGRPRVRDLQSFVGEMRGSDIERLKPKICPHENHSKTTIATVHKVKGLEFDTVLIMPSSESFPFSAGNGQCPGPSGADAAEEARLYYVAMTRARTRLYGGWGDREQAWWRCDGHKAEQDAIGFRLEGSPSELFVSWPGQSDQVQGGVQAYIERQICVGDPLDLRNRCLKHDGHTVGLLSRSAVDSLLRAGGSSRLRVSNVIRYTCGNYFREHNRDFWDKLDDDVKRQGWFYLVLAEDA
jgi:superfamily I DNA/RNA helicase